MAKRFCTNCGNELSDGMMFCVNCGTKVPEVTQETAAPVEEEAPEASNEAPETEETPVEPVVEETPAAPEPAPYTYNPEPAASADAFNDGFTPAPAKKSFDMSKLFCLRNIIIAASALVLLIVVIVVVLLTGNTYKTPINTFEKAYACKYGSAEKMAYDCLNGLCKSEYSTVIKLLKKTEYYADYLEEQNESLEENKERLADEYGEGFKVTITVGDKEELNKKETKNEKEYIEKKFASLDNTVSKLKNLDSDGWEDYFGIDKSTGKELIKAIEALEKAGKKLDASAAYGVEMTVFYAGSDDDDEIDRTLSVVKVNGKWVCADEIEEAIYFIRRYINYCFN